MLQAMLPLFISFTCMVAVSADAISSKGSCMLQTRSLVQKVTPVTEFTERKAETSYNRIRSGCFRMMDMCSSSEAEVHRYKQMNWASTQLGFLCCCTANYGAELCNSLNGTIFDFTNENEPGFQPENPAMFAPEGRLELLCNEVGDLLHANDEHVRLLGSSTDESLVQRAIQKAGHLGKALSKVGMAAATSLSVAARFRAVKAHVERCLSDDICREGARKGMPELLQRVGLAEPHPEQGIYDVKRVSDRDGISNSARTPNDQVDSCREVANANCAECLRHYENPAGSSYPCVYDEVERKCFTQEEMKSKASPADTTCYFEHRDVACFGECCDQGILSTGATTLSDSQVHRDEVCNALHVSGDCARLSDSECYTHYLGCREQNNTECCMPVRFRDPVFVGHVNHNEGRDNNKAACVPFYWNQGLEKSVPGVVTLITFAFALLFASGG